MQRVRVYMAYSFDGYIAGPDNDISWLHAPRAVDGDLSPSGKALGFSEFMQEVGCLLMGRTTYDVVQSFGEWAYGETPVLVATTRELTGGPKSVRGQGGSIQEPIQAAKDLAGNKDVYLDGGALVQQALKAGLVDEIIATMVPVLLGNGSRLFGELADRQSLQFTAHEPMENGMLQVRAKVVKG